MSVESVCKQNIWFRLTYNINRFQRSIHSLVTCTWQCYMNINSLSTHSFYSDKSMQSYIKFVNTARIMYKNYILFTTKAIYLSQTRVKDMCVNHRIMYRRTWIIFISLKSFSAVWLSVWKIAESLPFHCARPLRSIHFHENEYFFS